MKTFLLATLHIVLLGCTSHVFADIDEPYSGSQNAYFNQSQSNQSYNSTSEKIGSSSAIIDQGQYRTGKDKLTLLRIYEVLKNRKINVSNISIAVYDSNVILNGQVSSIEEARVISDAVRSVFGVVDVDNRLLVNPPQSDQKINLNVETPVPSTASRLNESQRRTRSSAGGDRNYFAYTSPNSTPASPNALPPSSVQSTTLQPSTLRPSTMPPSSINSSTLHNYSGNNWSNYDPAAGAVSTTDTQLSHRIQAVLDDSIYAAKYETLTFEIDNGTVTLRGFVLYQDEKDKIADRIRRIPYVKRVNNQLIVRPR